MQNTHPLTAKPALNASAAAVLAAANSTRFELRRAAAYHPGLTMEARMRLTFDSHPEVREWTINALEMDDQVLEMSYDLAVRCGA